MYNPLVAIQLINNTITTLQRVLDQWRNIQRQLHRQQLILRKRIVRESCWDHLALGTKQTSERDHEEDDRYSRGKGIGVTILGYTRVAGGTTNEALAILGGERDWDTECG
ncbi:hypothetical protein ETB97_009825 [Aspergillus alliaceus]|uniref:Uncharacterized protein n=1 Tax=Petromyces alliaceus TaxID=209559 RepID=A0A8H6E8R0_PETAA|nr:hypothetical protein ETB97_009825 [Aspergillus burnettii]